MKGWTLGMKTKMFPKLWTTYFRKTKSPVIKSKRTLIIDAENRGRETFECECYGDYVGIDANSTTKLPSNHVYGWLTRVIRSDHMVTREGIGKDIVKNDENDRTLGKIR